MPGVGGTNTPSLAPLLSQICPACHCHCYALRSVFLFGSLLSESPLASYIDRSPAGLSTGFTLKLTLRVAQPAAECCWRCHCQATREPHIAQPTVWRPFCVSLAQPPSRICGLPAVCLLQPGLCACALFMPRRVCCCFLWT